ncbi:hypothetical protein BDN72DRAFT_862700 [Pluteus cervinus]|uniref:Uncharacterized protein n=1 Tax=Pluteus cervinus TaxID=181527 RepID=A0ACD3A9U1_9AGAR|nr:hypothetical protein BDN72DRAFT_862700 [Pluteus cervinus]
MSSRSKQPSSTTECVHQLNNYAKKYHERDSMMLDRNLTQQEKMPEQTKDYQRERGKGEIGSVEASHKGKPFKWYNATETELDFHTDLTIAANYQLYQHGLTDRCQDTGISSLAQREAIEERHSMLKNSQPTWISHFRTLLISLELQTQRLPGSERATKPRSATGDWLPNVLGIGHPSSAKFLDISSQLIRPIGIREALNGV